MFQTQLKKNNMTPTQTRQTLKIILDWMIKNDQGCIDNEYIAYGIWPDPKNKEKSVRLTFPVPLHTFNDFHQSLGKEFTEEFYDCYQDRGFGESYKNEADGGMWRFPENRLFFKFENTKFIWRWMTGQGDAVQLILAGKYDRAPFDEKKSIEIK